MKMRREGALGQDKSDTKTSEQHGPVGAGGASCHFSEDHNADSSANTNDGSDGNKMSLPQALQVAQTQDIHHDDKGLKPPISVSEPSAEGVCPSKTEKCECRECTQSRPIDASAEYGKQIGASAVSTWTGETFGGDVICPIMQCESLLCQGLTPFGDSRA